MDYFEYKNGSLHAEDVDLSEIASTYGTPCYVYSRATIERHWHAFNDVFGGRDHLVCYAVKANSNIAVLNILARIGSGFDIVSGGELERVLRAGGNPDKVVFSGVAKTHAEIKRALEVGIGCFNVESEGELFRINEVAEQLNIKAPVSLRVNPDIDANTHPYISTGLRENKFGIDIGIASDIYARAAELIHIDVIGMDCHIGSQLTDLDPFIEALDRLLELAEALGQQGIHIRHLDIGGGLGVTYLDEKPPLPADYAAALMQRLGDKKYKIIMEPGRAIVANAGILLMRVEYLKCSEYKNFAVVDAGMNDLLRPSLYSAWQNIIPVEENSKEQPCHYDVVGPVCETGDFIGKDRELAIVPGDLLATRSAGAYGFSMSSNYNSRPRAAEVMVDGDQMYLIRRRETIEDLIAGETLLP